MNPRKLAKVQARVPVLENEMMKEYSWQPPQLPQNWRTVMRDDETRSMAFKSRDGLAVIVSLAFEIDNNPWIHLSVSRKKSLPSWNDLVKVKELFLGEELCAVQVIPPRSEYINHHEYCLNIFARMDDRAVPDFRGYLEGFGVTL